MSEDTGFDFSAARDATNRQLAGDLAKLVPLTQQEIDELLPKVEDKLHLQKILNIVNAASTQNEKLAALQSNFTQLGGVVVTLLTKFLAVTA